MSNYAQQQLKASGVAQVIVVLKQPAQAAAAATELGQHFTLTETSAAVAVAHATGRKRPRPMRLYKNLGIMFGTVDEAGLKSLAKNKGVEEVTSAPMLSLIRPIVRAAAGAGPKGTTWGIKALGIEKLWKKGFTGNGILVGHLDTGVDGTHPALKGAIHAFAEFDKNGDMVKPNPKPWDSGDHGTHTAATIAGRDVKGTKVGVAPEALLASAMVIEGGNVIERVLGGMDWAVGQGVRILNMSLGFRGYIDDFEPLTAILRQRNVLPVFAVGNDEAGFSRSPGNYVNVLSVGACDKRLTIPDFSSSQLFDRQEDPRVPDLVAPGVNVFSAVPGGGFVSMDGSSMATPHIAGLAALLFQAVPSATAEQIERAILGSCSLPATMDQERANRGFPDAVQALKLLLPNAAAISTAIPAETPRTARSRGRSSSRTGATRRRTRRNS